MDIGGERAVWAAVGNTADGMGGCRGYSTNGGITRTEKVDEKYPTLLCFVRIRSKKKRAP